MSVVHVIPRLGQDLAFQGKGQGGVGGAPLIRTRVRKLSQPTGVESKKTIPPKERVGGRGLTSAQGHLLGAFCAWLRNFQTLQDQPQYPYCLAKDTGFREGN